MQLRSACCLSSTLRALGEMRQWQQRLPVRAATRIVEPASAPRAAWSVGSALAVEQTWSSFVNLLFINPIFSSGNCGDRGTGVPHAPRRGCLGPLGPHAVFSLPRPRQRARPRLGFVLTWPADRALGAVEWGATAQSCV